MSGRQSAQLSDAIHASRPYLSPDIVAAKCKLVGRLLGIDPTLLRCDDRLEDLIPPWSKWIPFVETNVDTLIAEMEDEMHAHGVAEARISTVEDCIVILSGGRLAA